MEEVSRMDGRSADDVGAGRNHEEGMGRFLRALTGYYANFLETSFHKSQLPKRKFSTRDQKNNKVGLRLEKYPYFREHLLSRLGGSGIVKFQVTPGKYKAAVPPAIRSGIDSAITKIDTTDLALTLLLLGEDLKNLVGTPDLERLVEETSDKISEEIEKGIVFPVIGLLGTLLEGQSALAVAVDALETYTIDVVNALFSEAKEELPTAVSELVLGSRPEAWAEMSQGLCDLDRTTEKLKDYFADFGAADLHSELREIFATKQLIENSEVYINIGEISTDKAAFPLYFCPASISMAASTIELELQSHVFINKRAVDYVAGELARLTETTIPSPITERIFYSDGEQSHIDLVEKTIHRVLAGLQARGEISIDSSGVSSASGPGYQITNKLSVTLSDKSDESIINDYEALMTGLGEGGELISEFGSLIAGFLTSNPVSVEPVVDQEWRDTPPGDRLVFESPLPLAEEQRKITAAIRSEGCRFIAVEGPPGTGKSHTIAAIAFEQILNGKSILILSDKTEALNVVQSKLNGVLERVRGVETDYVNPILRLGKTDSNYSNIVKNSSIQKLKTSLDTFRATEGDFLKGFESVKETLQSTIDDCIEKSGEIDLKEIEEFHKDEQSLIERYPELGELDDETEELLLLQANVQEFVENNRPFFGDYLAGGPGREEIFLRHVSDVKDVIQYLSEYDVSIMERYPSLRLELAGELGAIVRTIQDLRNPIFGYLFSGSGLRDEAGKLQKILGTPVVKPQKIIKDLLWLEGIEGRLTAALSGRGLSAGCAVLLHRMVAYSVTIGSADLHCFSALSQHEEIDRAALPLPKSLSECLSLDSRLKEMLKAFRELRLREDAITAAFESVPDYDYLKAKTDFEDLNAQLLANKIDERVVSFVQEKRADARTLQQIIKNKGKFPAEKFELLKEAFPCMIAGLREYAEFIPLKSELFDLVIIDEASQVSIAQALPAILRAKKMVVMGDRRQFGNVKTAQASIALNNAYFSKVREEFDDAVAFGDVSKLERLRKLNITNSVMDFFELVTNYSIQLRKHFRGYPELIGFSSKFFYDGSLQVLKIRGKPIDQVLEFVENDDPDAIEIHRNANHWEAEKILERLEQLLCEEKPPSVAIITPFREQQGLISRMVSDHRESERFRKELKVAVFTFDTCQGEERDVIMYSMVATRAVDRLNYIFPKDLRVSEEELDGKLKFQRLNVGFSRGKEKLIFVVSKPLEEFSGSARQALLHYRDALDGAMQGPSSDDVDQSSPMEAMVLEWLKSTAFVTSHQGNLEIVPQFELGKYLKSLDAGYSHPAYKVDFLLRLTIPNGTVVQAVIEYDGFEYHFDSRDGVDALNWRSYLSAADVERECVLESYGYKILRINRFNVGRDPVSELDRRLQKLFDEFDAGNDQHELLRGIQSQTAENISGLADGTQKRCSSCGKIRPKQDFYDKSLKSKYGRLCKSCKTAGSRSSFRSVRPRYARRPRR